ncbi:MAG TPA: helix-turn-helix domain-containing protein [Thermoleophilaceae bacterium]|nr:helix-turn-helix domain-containing protein [Thermoleophilaceae bacterium]
MARSSLDQMNCSIARTLDVIGDAWTPLILRDIAFGISRFDAIQRDLGISRKVLSERLSALVAHGVLQRVPYQDKPARYDYHPTEKGADLAFVLLAMQAWGDRWTAGDDGPPILIRHETCGALTKVVPSCASCGKRLAVTDITPLRGPGFESGPGNAEISAVLDRRDAAAAEA